MTDVIICLGHSFSSDRTIELMKSRVKKSVDLYMDGKGKKILFTGGFHTNKDMSEASFMSDIAVEMGVPMTDIVLEESANFTIENAYYSQKVMESNEMISTIVVTSRTHFLRTKYIFSKVMPHKILRYACPSDDKDTIKEYWADIKRFFRLLKNGIDDKYLK